MITSVFALREFLRNNPDPGSEEFDWEEWEGSGFTVSQAYSHGTDYPVFGGEPPLETAEIISWDENDLLFIDMTIESREEHYRPR